MSGKADGMAKDLACLAVDSPLSNPFLSQNYQSDINERQKQSGSKTEFLNESFKPFQGRAITGGEKLGHKSLILKEDGWLVAGSH